MALAASSRLRDKSKRVTNTARLKQWFVLDWSTNSDSLLDTYRIRDGILLARYSYRRLRSNPVMPC